MRIAMDRAQLLAEGTAHPQIYLPEYRKEIKQFV